MPKIKTRLAEMRTRAVIYLSTSKYTVEEISNLFGMTISAVYQIIKDSKVDHKKG